MLTCAFGNQQCRHSLLGCNSVLKTCPVIIYIIVSSWCIPALMFFKLSLLDIMLKLTTDNIHSPPISFEPSPWEKGSLITDPQPTSAGRVDPWGCHTTWGQAHACKFGGPRFQKLSPYLCLRWWTFVSRLVPTYLRSIFKPKPELELVVMSKLASLSLTSSSVRLALPTPKSSGYCKIVYGSTK